MGGHITNRRYFLAKLKKNTGWRMVKSNKTGFTGVWKNLVFHSSNIYRSMLQARHHNWISNSFSRSTKYKIEQGIVPAYEGGNQAGYRTLYMHVNIIHFFKKSKKNNR